VVVVEAEASAMGPSPEPDLRKSACFFHVVGAHLVEHSLGLLRGHDEPRAREAEAKAEPVAVLVSGVEAVHFRVNHIRLVELGRNKFPEHIAHLGVLLGPGEALVAREELQLKLHQEVDESNTVSVLNDALVRFLPWCGRRSGLGRLRRICRRCSGCICESIEAVEALLIHVCHSCDTVIWMLRLQTGKKKDVAE